MAKQAERLRPGDPEILHLAAAAVRGDLTRIGPGLKAAELDRMVRLVLDRVEDVLGDRIPRPRRTPALTPRPPLRGEDWGAAARDVLELRRALDHLLGAPRARHLGGAGLAVRILASAFLRGGLWRP